MNILGSCLANNKKITNRNKKQKTIKKDRIMGSGVDSQVDFHSVSGVKGTLAKSPKLFKNLDKLSGKDKLSNVYVVCTVCVNCAPACYSKALTVSSAPPVLTVFFRSASRFRISRARSSRMFSRVVAWRRPFQPLFMY